MQQRTNISNYGYTGTSPFRGSGDEVVDYILSTTDYDPFGMIMNGRDWNPGEYRFGFNGQEKDQEIYNNQSTTTAMFWEYDGRIGRRWNLDPKPDMSISQYAVFANNPILYSDVLGDTIRNKHVADYQKKNIAGVSRTGESTTIEKYNVVPVYDAGNKNLLGYHAGRDDANGEYRVEYQLDVGDLNFFSENINMYTAAADWIYSYGIPSEGLIKMMAGDNIEGLADLWGDAITSPEFYMPSPKISVKSVRVKGSLSGYNNYVSKNKYPSGSHKGKGNGSASKSYSQGYKTVLQKQAKNTVKNINTASDIIYESIMSIFYKNETSNENNKGQ